MKTELFGKSNAVLFTDEGEFVAVIGCEGGKDKDISNKLNRAIKDHFCLEDGTVITFDVKEVLTNQKSVKFSVSYVEDEEDTIREFEIQIVAHY